MAMTGSIAAAERRASVSDAVSPTTFGPNSVTPASPRSSARRIQGGGVVPGNGGMRMASASAASAGSMRGSVRRHPFTAPATRPLASRRWVSRKNARTGMVKRVEDAMIAPQLVEFWP